MVLGLEKKIGMAFVLAVLALFLTACGFKDNEISGDTAVSNKQPGPGSENVKEMVVVKTFALSGENFKFIMDGIESPDLVVDEGDKVRVELVSGQGFHDFVIDEFNAATSKVKDGETTFVEFTADKKGTFDYYCSVGEHRKMGMKGKLIVN